MINNQLLPDEAISNKIYYIRNQKVMLDRDLAEMYGTIPIRLRQQVKRNMDRFPEHFMFQLTDEEVSFMVSQNVIPSRQFLGGALPYAFSEHGILMLANVVKSQQAITMSIRIIEVFVKFREMVLSQWTFYLNSNIWKNWSFNTTIISAKSSL